MTSFLNKKFGLILLVLATILIMSISSASAATVDIIYADGNSSTVVNYGESVTVNVTVNSTSNVSNNTVGDLSVYYFGWNNTTAKKLAGQSIQVVNGTAKTIQFTINTKDIPYLGFNDLYAVYVSNNDTNDSDNSISSSTTNGQVIIYIKGNTTIVWDSVVGLKVGQAGNITGKVYGQNATNASQIILLPYVAVEILDGALSPIITVFTNENGTFTYECPLIPTIKFNLTARTDMTNDTEGNASGYLPIPTYNGHFNYTVFSDLYNDTNVTQVFTAGLGDINITALWWDSPYGYIVGQNSTLYWNISGYGDIANQNIVAYVVLFDRDNMNKELRRYAVNLYNATGSLNGVACNGFLQLSEFIAPHIELVAVLVVNGFDRNTSQYMYNQARKEADTFVDASNASRRTTIESVVFPVGGLKVGAALQPIAITVKSFNGTLVQDGFVVVTWDGKYSSEPIPVINGVALYEHVYELAGSARKMSVQYLGNIQMGGTDGPSPVWKDVNVSVAKGSPLVTVVPDTITPFVGDTSTIVALIDGLVLNGAPAVVTFTFTSNGKVVATHTADIKAGLNPGEAIAEITHTFIRTHTLLSIKASIAGNANYNAVASPVVTLVVV